MFGSIGFQELFFIFVIALIIFGPNKLPELGKFLGKTMSEFRKASNDLKSALHNEMTDSGLNDIKDIVNSEKPTPSTPEKTDLKTEINPDNEHDRPAK